MFEMEGRPCTAAGPSSEQSGPGMADEFNKCRTKRASETARMETVFQSPQRERSEWKPLCPLHADVFMVVCTLEINIYKQCVLLSPRVVLSSLARPELKNVFGVIKRDLRTSRTPSNLAGETQGPKAGRESHSTS